MSTDRKAELERLHWDENLSVKQIAELEGTYPNKIGREMNRLGVRRRSSKEAAQLAYSTGRIKHPTLGTTLPPEVRVKIGKALHNAITPEDRERNRKNSLKGWAEAKQKNKLAGVDRGRQLRQVARKTMQTGSKMEHELFRFLVSRGYACEQNRENLLPNDRLRVDLFIPGKETAIEIDGPSHWSPIYGQEAYNQQILLDNEKNGLLMAAGFKIIRIKHTINKTRAWYVDEVCNKIDQLLQDDTRSDLIFLEITSDGKTKICESRRNII